MKIPPCFVLTRVSVSDTLTRTHHLFLFCFCFFMFLVIALFYFYFIIFFRVFDSFGFQSRCLHLPSAEHTNSFPIETPSLSKFCYCLCICKIHHSATYSSKITLQPSGLFFSSRQHVFSAAVLQKKTQLSRIDYLIRKAATLSAIN